MNRVEITLHDILWALKKYLIWILLASVLCSFGAWFYTSYFVEPIYAAEFSVGIRSAGPDSTIATEQPADASLTNFYRDVFTCDVIVKDVSEKLNLPEAAIENMVSVRNRSDSPVLRVRVVSSDPQEAFDVAEALAETCPRALPRIVGSGSMFLVNAPMLPERPFSPNFKKNMAYGFVVGLLLSCAVVILIAVLDTTIWREDDLSRNFQYPVLGSVPSMLPETDHRRKRRG